MQSILAKYLEVVMPTNQSKDIALFTLAAALFVAWMKDFVQAVFNTSTAQAYWITAVFVLLTLLLGAFLCIASISREFRAMFSDNKALAEGIVQRDKTLAVRDAENGLIKAGSQAFTDAINRLSKEKEEFVIKATQEKQELLRQIARHREEKEKLYDDNCMLSNENREFKNKLLLMAQPPTSS